MKGTRKQTWAQRKFAQGYQPPIVAASTSSISREEPTVETRKRTEETQKTVLHNLSAPALMNFVSFKGIHNHGHPVVMLKRLEVDDDDTPLTFLRECKKNKQLAAAESTSASTKAPADVQKQDRTSMKRKCTEKNYKRPTIAETPIVKARKVAPSKRKKIEGKKECTLCSSDHSPKTKVLKKLPSKTPPAIETIAVPRIESGSNNVDASNVLPESVNNPLQSPTVSKKTQKTKTSPLRKSQKSLTEHEEIVAPSTINQTNEEGGDVVPEPDKNYYDSTTIQQWIEGEVLSDTSSLIEPLVYLEDEPVDWCIPECPSKGYKTVRQVISASPTELEKMCRTCSPCRRVDKVLKLITLVRTPGDSSDVYNFEDVEESVQSHRFRSRRAAASDPDSNNLYLDLLAHNSPQIVKITFADAPNCKKQILRAGLVPRAEAIDSDLYLDDSEDLVDQLLSTLAVNVPPPLPMQPHSTATQKPLVPWQPLPSTSATAGRVQRPDTDEKPPVEDAPTSAQRKGEFVIVDGGEVSSSESVEEHEDKVHRRWGMVEAVATILSNDTPEPSLTEDPQPLPAPTQTPTSAAAEPETGPDTKNNIGIVTAPTFYPTVEEFKDPIAYFEKIMSTAEEYSICKIVVPEGFNPSCKLERMAKFNVMNQYIVRLFRRWGSALRAMCAIKAHLASQSVIFSRAPLVDGMEVNLPKLFNLVQQQGGLRKVIEKKRWSRIAEQMRYTKLAKPEKTLDQIYVKYLLPYDTMSNRERTQILSAVDKCWTKKNQRILSRAVSPLHRQKKLLNGGESSSSESSEDEDEGRVVWALVEAEDCIVSGRSMQHPTFKKIAANMLASYFPGPEAPTSEEVEKEYWRLVSAGTDYVCVYTASIDTGELGLGFPTNADDPISRHPWNLKVMSKNKANMLRFMGPVVGLTTPTLHLGMLFSTSCWHRDPHGLPWVEYLHNGPNKIWYGISDGQSEAFRKAVETLCPSFCQNKTVWLPSDITMIPPELLVEHGVTLARLEQKPREFVLVLPKAYSCSICTGYTESESVYFATGSWFDSIGDVFGELRATCEPTMFALEHLLLRASASGELDKARRKRAAAWLQQVLNLELTSRRALVSAGVKVLASPACREPSAAWDIRNQSECEICRATLYLSAVKGISESSTSCPTHALHLLSLPKHKLTIGQVELMIKIPDEELKIMLNNALAILSNS